MTTTNTLGGKAVLSIAHVAGMIDMVALPVWIGVLIQHYGYDSRQAGLTVTLFLVGVVLASLVIAPRFNRLPRRLAAMFGFSLAAVVFFVTARQPVGIASFEVLAALHLLAGVGVGSGLSVTHGCIGRSANPHRLFAVANTALGVFAVIFFGAVPQIIQQIGAAALFNIYAGLMALAAVVVTIGFPTVAESAPEAAGTPAPLALGRIPKAAWIVSGVVVCLTLNQSMIFSFIERIGVDRGFGVENVNGVLIALGLVNLTPAVLAALLQNRVSPISVGMFGPIGQAVLALTIVNATVFMPYAVATSLYVFMVIFSHAFLFGMLARLDPSGRAVAATPAMMMVGSCIGPALGGVLIHSFGYTGLGWAAAIISTAAVLGMSQVRRRMPGDSPPALQPKQA